MSSAMWDLGAVLACLAAAFAKVVVSTGSILPLELLLIAVLFNVQAGREERRTVRVSGDGFRIKITDSETAARSLHAALRGR